MTIDRTTLRRLHNEWQMCRGNESRHAFADAALALLPELLHEANAADRRISELETMVQRRDAQSQLAGDRITGLELRLSIATELNVGDRKRIAELETGLREALNNWEDVAHFDHDTIIRLRDLLPSEET